jgi:hypothetical protein
MDVGFLFCNLLSVKKVVKTRRVVEKRWKEDTRRQWLTHNIHFTVLFCFLTLANNREWVVVVVLQYLAVPKHLECPSIEVDHARREWDEVPVRYKFLPTFFPHYLKWMVS